MEPETMPRETSQLLAKVFAALREDGVRKSDLAEDLQIPVSELDELVFGLVLNAVEHNPVKQQGRSVRRGSLTLVK